MIAIGEETGALPELLDEVAGYYEREVDHALKNLSAAIEPILIVAVGGMVLILALGIFMPLWEVISKAGQMTGCRKTVSFMAPDEDCLLITANAHRRFAYVHGPAHIP